MAAVVEEGVHRFLQHALLVPDDDLRGLELQQLLEAVVAVDDPAVEIVQVGGRETPTVQGNQRPQVRRNDRKDRHDHPLRTGVRPREALGQLEALGELLAGLLRAGVLHGLLELRDDLTEAALAEQITNCFRTHPGPEGIFAVVLLRVSQLRLGKQLPFLEGRLAGVGHHVVLVVDHPLKLAGAHVEHQADPAGHALVEPDVAHRHGQLDVAHALAADPGEGHLHAAAVADDALVLDALVLAAGALPVAGRTEDPLAEQTAFLGLEGPIVDGFRILDLAPAPGPDYLRRGDRDGNLVKGLRLVVNPVKFAQIGFNTHEFVK